MKITKKLQKEFLQEKLSNNTQWAQKGLIRIYEHQTEDEQSHGDTHNLNGVGFNGVDGYILSSFSKQLIKNGYLSSKQMAIVFKKMKKYWKQILVLSDEQKMNELILKSI